MGKNMFLFSGCKGSKNVKEHKINIVKTFLKKQCVFAPCNYLDVNLLSYNAHSLQ